MADTPKPFDAAEWRYRIGNLVIDYGDARENGDDLNNPRTAEKILQSAGGLLDEAVAALAAKDDALSAVIELGRVATTAWEKQYNAVDDENDRLLSLLAARPVPTLDRDAKKLLRTKIASLGHINPALAGPLIGEIMGEIEALAAKEAPPATIPANSQDWAGMDGAIAFHLIERHADGWNDVGKMMGEWLEANRQPRTVAPAGAVRVYLVTSGIVTNEGIELYERHDVRPPLCDAEVLYTAQPTAEECSAVAPADADLYRAIKQRDHAQEQLDQLIAQVAAITGEDMGEHSSANDPWRNAMDAAGGFIARRSVAEPRAYLIRHIDHPEAPGQLIDADKVGLYDKVHLTRQPLYTAPPMTMKEDSNAE